MVGRRLISTLALFCGVGCSQLEPFFACDASAQCVSSAGLQGACQGNGSCSFVDSACASGQRYAPHARADLVGGCVDVQTCQATLRRINSCGLTLPVASGVSWDSDVSFDGGFCFQEINVPVFVPDGGGFAPAELYQTYRYDRDAPFWYELPSLVPTADYVLRLHFAEIEDKAVGDRAFSVAVGNEVRLTGLDVLAMAGGADRALVLELSANPSDDGEIRVGFFPSARDAGRPDPASFVSGLELLGCPSH